MRVHHAPFGACLPAFGGGSLLTSGLSGRVGSRPSSPARFRSRCGRCAAAAAFRERKEANRHGGTAGAQKASRLADMRHPELKINVPPSLLCVSWCPDFEFRGTYSALHGLGERQPHSMVL